MIKSFSTNFLLNVPNNENESVMILIKHLGLKNEEKLNEKKFEISCTLQKLHIMSEFKGRFVYLNFTKYKQVNDNKRFVVKSSLSPDELAAYHTLPFI